MSLPIFFFSAVFSLLLATVLALSSVFPCFPSSLSLSLILSLSICFLLFLMSPSLFRCRFQLPCFSCCSFAILHRRLVAVLVPPTIRTPVIAPRHVLSLFSSDCLHAGAWLHQTKVQNDGYMAMVANRTAEDFVRRQIGMVSEVLAEYGSVSRLDLEKRKGEKED